MNSVSSREPAIAYLAQGRLFVRKPRGTVREIESAFGQQVRERQERNRELHGWKSASGVWGSMGMAAPSISQWEATQARRAVRFQSVARGKSPAEIYYTLDLGSVGGLFLYDLDQDYERRLMHREGFQARDLACHGSDGYVAFSVARDDGSVGIAIGENDGRRLNQVSGGDSVDETPAWVGGVRRLVYQSAMIGRDPNGHALALGPYAIETLDIDTKNIATLLEDEATDYLMPRMLADDTLYYIRRPYKPFSHPQANPLTLLQDIVFFPFRLLRAIFHFLNFFSMMFAGEPLATAGGPKRKTSDTRFMMVWGRMIDTKAAIEKADRDKPTNLVPNDWQLVRRAPDGTDQTIAENVLAYDVDEQGQIVLTNGSAIFFIDADGEKQELCTDQMIEKVVVLGQN